jgi:hypothetical protein
MNVTMIQRLGVLVAVCAAIGASFLQATGALGLTPAEFANTGASTLRAASYAFAIWGLIYAGLLVYGLYQLAPNWADANVLARFAMPAMVSMFAIGAWLVAAGADWRWATIALIVLAALALIIPLSRPLGPIKRRDLFLVVTPLALLAGWLTIASALNIVTVLTAQGYVAGDAALAYAIAALLSAGAVTLFVFLRGGALAYPLPVIWGLVAVFIAERDHRPEAAFLALGLSLVLALVWIWRVARALSTR